MPHIGRLYTLKLKRKFAQSKISYEKPSMEYKNTYLSFRNCRASRKNHRHFMALDDINFSKQRNPVTFRWYAMAVVWSEKYIYLILNDMQMMCVMNTTQSLNKNHFDNRHHSVKKSALFTINQIFLWPIFFHQKIHFVVLFQSKTILNYSNSSFIPVARSCCLHLYDGTFRCVWKKNGKVLSFPHRISVPNVWNISMLFNCIHKSNLWNSVFYSRISRNAAACRVTREIPLPLVMGGVSFCAHCQSEFDWILIDMWFVLWVYFTNIYLKYGQQPSQLHAFPPFVVNNFSHSSRQTLLSYIASPPTTAYSGDLLATAKERNLHIM